MNEQENSEKGKIKKTVNYIGITVSLLICVAFAIGGTIFSQSRVEIGNKANEDSALKVALSLEGATSVEHAIELGDAQKKLALEGFELLSEIAKAEVSVRFVELSESQNKVGLEAREILHNMVDHVKFLENFNWETESQNDIDALLVRLEALCPQMEIYNSKFNRLISILDEKIILASHPNVIKELFKGDNDFIFKLKQFKESQERILEAEKESYQFLCVELLRNYEEN